MNYHTDPMKCACLTWAETPYTGNRKEGEHHQACPMGHEVSCVCQRCSCVRGRPSKRGQQLLVGQRNR
jgi:hypothetical protein